MSTIYSRGLRGLAALSLLAIVSTATGPSAVAHEVSEFHGSNRRDGAYVVPSLTFERARHMSLVAGFDGRIKGNVYAQLLSFRLSQNEGGLLLAVTESNMVFALDAASGKVVWEKSLGPSVALSTLPCGDIDPLGITGTPAIDERRQAVYFDAMVNSDPNLDPQHVLFALRLKDGSVVSGFPINVAQALSRQHLTFEPRFQNQRSALTIVGDRLFVPYGGHFGDCGPYHGWVLSMELAAPDRISAWETRGVGAGIWTPGGMAYDGRALVAATGNTKRALRWSDGEAIIKLEPGPQAAGAPRDFFAPKRWRLLDMLDLDMGGTNPVLLDLPQGGVVSRFVLALGKDGKAYLLNRDSLGGIGEALLAQEVAAPPIRTAPAVYSTTKGALVIFQGSPNGCPSGVAGNGLGALDVTVAPSPKISMAWCGPINGRGSPIVTTSDGRSDPIAWVTGAEGDNCLHAFRADTGAPLLACGSERNAMHNLRRFSTILAAFGRLFVAGDDRVYAYAPSP